MRPPLTKRQRTYLRLCVQWVERHHRMPTLRELMEPLGVRSVRGVTTHRDALERKGYLAVEGQRCKLLRDEHGERVVVRVCAEDGPGPVLHL